MNPCVFAQGTDEIRKDLSVGVADDTVKDGAKLPSLVVGA